MALIFLFYRSEMNRTLAGEIEFKNLCDVLEEISGAHFSKKADILKQFIQKCRLMSHKLKTEFATVV